MEVGVMTTTKFRVGDEVIITENGGYHYGITKAGSYGTILNLDDDRVRVEFKYLSTRPIYKNGSNKYWINVDDLVLYEDTQKPYFKVIRKIEMMEQRRKKMGYAF